MSLHVYIHTVRTYMQIHAIFDVEVKESSLFPAHDIHNLDLRVKFPPCESTLSHSGNLTSECRSPYPTEHFKSVFNNHSYLPPHSVMRSANMASIVHSDPPWRRGTL